MTAPFSIRQATEPEAAARLVDWARMEGWNPAPTDAATFHAADPKGWWLAETPEGEAIGGLSLVHSDDRSFAFLGLYIVHPDWRGKGVGWASWRAALNGSEARSVGLDGVPAQQANYAKSGFALAFTSHRFSFSADSLPPARPDATIDLSGTPGPGLRALDKAVAYPASRDTFLNHWYSQPGAARGLVRDGTLVGCGVIRACHDGHKVGPLIAPDLDGALQLLAALVKAAGATKLILDIPEINPLGATLARDLAAETAFECARMYRGAPPIALDLDRLWGITTFELG
ncbi:MAG: GNAT family N-acetyltransferase [Rhodospirillum sp.]|nr:GNAT family N-acetyltransferase [Rhodospirillum sp.]MCF8490653.1 GNAT family N-acetyltransferase [Rhodospirillum sp.]MCF8502846.1 GNAT family N-acetyltransferase [Rhodospirillum sp.]